MNKEQLEHLAKQSYMAYGSVTEFKNYQGLPMPEWEALTDKIHEAWGAASRYAFNEGVFSVTDSAKTETPDHK